MWLYDSLFGVACGKPIAVLSTNVTDPIEEDEFDRDITSQLRGEEMSLLFAFAELHESFVALRQAGFSENQALKFLAFCSIHEGDYR